MAGRPGAGRPDLPSSQLSNAEYVTLVLLLAGAIVATALFVSWAYQQRAAADGLLAPARRPPDFDPDYSPPAAEA